MNSRRTLTLLFFLFLSISTWAQIVDNTFNVSLSGDLNYLKSFQLRAQLKLARSTDFCRGFTIPAIDSDWKCERTGGAEAKCFADFKCAMVKKGFSRKSETIRLSQKLRELKMKQVKFEMLISKRPFKDMKRYKVARESRQKNINPVSKTTRELIQEENNIYKKQLKLRSKRIKDQMTEMNEFAVLEQELDLATQKNKIDSSLANSRIETVEQMQAKALAADRKELDNSREESSEFGEDEELAQLELDNEEESSRGNESEGEGSNKKTEAPSKFELLSFGTGMFSISDNEGSSVMTFGILWSPLWQLTKNWQIKGDLSWHPFSAIVESGEDAETFNIIEVGAQVEWRVFGGGVFLSAGFGMQNWGSSVGGSFASLSLGGGYYFEEKQGRLIDYLFAKQVTVSNETSNVEFVGGLGFVF